MAITNIGAGGPPNGGLFVSQGTNIRQAILDFTTEIANATGSRWSKVTSSTTPSELQPYATTITSTNAGNNNRGFDQHVTLYLDDDPSLNFSTPAGRFLRFWRHQGGMIVSAIDQVHKDTPSDITNWAHASNKQRGGMDSIKNDDDVNGEPERVITFLNFPGGGGDYPRDSDEFRYNDQGANQDFKWYYYLTADYIWMGFYGIDRTNNFGAGRGGAFWHPSPPANGTISRQDHPFIWHANFGSMFNSWGGQQDLVSPATGGRDLTTNGRFDHFIAAKSRDFQDRAIISPVFATRGGSTGDTWHFDNFVPELRVSGRSTAIDTEDQNFPTVNISGDRWMLAGGQRTGDAHYFLKLTGNV